MPNRVFVFSMCWQVYAFIYLFILPLSPLRPSSLPPLLKPNSARDSTNRVTG